MKMKKALLTVLCAVALVVSTVFGTLAYLTDDDAVTNTFTVGKVQIHLDETDVDDTKTGEILTEDRDQQNDYHLLPGQTYVKDPMVTVKAGSEDCYVRMFLTINKSSEWDTICAQYKKADETNIGIMDILTGYDSTKWTYKGNTENLAANNTRTYEFWYSTKVTDVPETANKSIDALFTGIKMPGELTNADLAKLGDDFKIYVVAQAIQAAGFETGDAEAAFAAAPAITGTDLMPSVTTPTPTT